MQNNYDIFIFKVIAHTCNLFSSTSSSAIMRQFYVMYTLMLISSLAKLTMSSAAAQSD